MRGTIFIETLKRSWRAMVYWGIGLGVMAIWFVMMVPFFDGLDLVALLDSMPDFIKPMMGFGDDLSILGTSEGLVAGMFFGKMSLIFVVYPVVMGLRITVNEEDEGILDIELSLPTARWQVVIEKFAAYTVTTIGVVAFIHIGMLLGAQFIQQDMPLNTDKMIPTIVSLVPMLIFIMAFTVFIGMLLRRKQTIVGVVTGFIVASYVLQTIAGLISGALGDIMAAATFFNYFNAPNILANGGYIWSQFVGLLAVAAVLLAASIWLFEQRDVAI